MQQLRRSFPQLVIENCAAGGHRFDYGIMRFSDVTWTSDVTDPSWLVRYHLFGASHAYPAHYLTTWYVHSSHDIDVSRATPAQLDALFRSRMLGAFGVSDTLASWPEPLAASARRSIALYKRMRRFLIGTQVWLTPMPEVFGPAYKEPKEWDAVQYWLSQSDESVIFAFRSASPVASLRLTPRHLNSRRIYELSDEDRQVKPSRLSGAELLRNGIEATAPDLHSSNVIFVRPA
jgi:hypothetical protein